MLIVANVMVALTIVGVASAYGYVHWRLGQIHTKQLTALTPSSGGGGAGGGASSTKSQAFTLLIVGSDSRAALSNTPDNTQFGAKSQRRRAAF